MDVQFCTVLLWDTVPVRDQKPTKNLVYDYADALQDCGGEEVWQFAETVLLSTTQ